MIRLREKISINTNSNGELYIQTDMGQTWKCMSINDASPMSKWLSLSSKHILQHWQKDMCKVVLDAYINQLPESGEASYQLYHAYQKGQGYTSGSDIMLMRIPLANIWFISTTDYTWIIEEKFENFTIFKSDAFASILDKPTRQMLYDWSDSMRGIKPNKIRYTDQDYLNKGLA